jgi:hypothetical protein
MDLTRLYNLTTPELREEAERIGVGDTYAMSRGQLIHSIRNKASGGQPAEGLLNKVLGFAKWALKAAQEEPRKEGAEATASVPASVPAPVPVPASASVPVSVSVPASEPGSGAAFGAATESENASSTSSCPPSRPPAGVFSKSAGMFEEPFPTLTMARILAEQGHFKRSLAIYAGLLRSEPGDRELSAEVKEVRARSRARRSQAH